MSNSNISVQQMQQLDTTISQTQSSIRDQRKAAEASFTNMRLNAETTSLLLGYITSDAQFSATNRLFAAVLVKNIV